VNTGETLLALDAAFDFMFCPCLLDTKRSDIEALPDGDLFLTLFNGALRTAENREMAELLRRKSRIFVAFGSCAASGGIPALGNHHGTRHILHTVYRAVPGLDNPEGRLPETSCSVPDGELELPSLLDRVLSLHQAVTVDYTMPGCPPEPEQITALLRHIAAGNPLPPAGGIIGATARAVCDTCSREKRDTLAQALVRPHEALPEAQWCLVEQGFACLGPSTRGGCAARCPSVAMPWLGCYGPLDPTADPGAAALSNLAAVVAPGAVTGTDEAVLHGRLRAALAGIADPLGTFYRYSLAETAVADRPAEEQP
jgi:F420-non-reducing hydrogenase small subunit